MNKIRKTTYPPVNIGTSFMLTIFIILCMILLSVLSLSSTLKDQNYSLKNAERVHAYYEANNKAEEQLALIDDVLSGADSIDHAKELLHKLNYVTISYKNTDQLTVSYCIPMNTSDSEVLEVVLAVHPDKQTNYTILTWKQISHSTWNSEQMLPVLGNDFE